MRFADGCSLVVLFRAQRALTIFTSSADLLLTFERVCSLICGPGSPGSTRLVDIFDAVCACVVWSSWCWLVCWEAQEVSPPVFCHGFFRESMATYSLSAQAAVFCVCFLPLSRIVCTLAVTSVVALLCHVCAVAPCYFHGRDSSICAAVSSSQRVHPP